MSGLSGRPVGWVLALSMVACSLDLEVPSEVEIDCTVDSQCVAGLVCLVDQGRCVSPSLACVEERDGGVFSVRNGNACSLASSAGICVDGDCVPTVCGDAFVDQAGGEECDDGPLNSDTTPDACRSNCRLPSCGDGVVDAGELCDDGNPWDNDDCKSASECVPNECHDGVVNPTAEQCDDGNFNDTDDCVGSCRDAVCGDRFVQVGIEECDDGNDDDADACVGCANARCGDGIIRAGVEACDDGEIDGQTAGADGCAADCSKYECCSDGIKDAGEECDDGNSNPNDDCSALCTTTSWQTRVITGLGQSQGVPRAADLRNPTGVAVDRHDNVYFTDPVLGRIFRVDAASGLLTVLAGTGRFGFAGEGSPASGADLVVPTSVAVDGIGNVYFTERDLHRVRVVDSSGRVHTVVGTGEAASTGDGGPAVAAAVNWPASVAVDAAGNVYVSERSGHRIRRIDVVTRKISTVAGTGTQGDSPNCTDALVCDLNGPAGLAVRSDGVVFFVEQDGDRLRRLDDGVLTTLLDVDDLDGPIGLAISGDGNVLVSDLGTTFDPISSAHSRIIAVDPDDPAAVEIVGGIGKCGYSGDGGPATEAELNLPSYLAVDSEDRIYFADAFNGLIRVVEGGTIDRFAGLVPEQAIPCGGAGVSDETAFTLVRALPGGIDVVGSERILAEPESRLVVRLSNFGDIERIAGTGEWGFDDGPGDAATFAYPRGVAAHAGVIYVADRDNHAVRKITGTTGAYFVATIAGTGIPGYSGDEGSALLAQLDRPSGIAVDSAGDIYIADYGNHVVRRIDGAGDIHTFIGTGETGFVECTDDPCDAPDATPLHHPADIGIALVAGFGDILVIADRGNHRVRVLYGASGLGIPYGLHTLAGIGRAGFSSDGPATQSIVELPRGLSYFDGELLVVEGHDRVRAIPASNSLELLEPQIRLVLGGRDPEGDGALARARLEAPTAIARESADRWLIADGSGGRIRRVELTAGIEQVETIVGYPEGLVPGQTGDLDPPVIDLLGRASGIAIDPVTSRVYFSDAEKHAVHTMDLSQGTPVVTPLLGSSGVPGRSCANTANCALRGPTALAIEAAADVGGARRLYVADTGNHAILALDLEQVGTVPVAVWAGIPGDRSFLGDGGPATQASLNNPSGLALGRDGSLYLSDTGNDRVRRVDRAGTISTVLTTGQPRGLTVDAHGNLFVASRGQVLRLTRDEPVSTVAVATGAGRVTPIYGATTLSYPESVTRCLSDVAVVDDSTLLAIDECVGLLFEVEITAATTEPPRGEGCP